MLKAARYNLWTVNLSKPILCLGIVTGIQGGDVEWPVNGGPNNIRYSPLTQITRENVGLLKMAWTYDSHDAFKDSEMQSNPIVVDGVLYATTPKLRVVALDAATGHEIWSFEPAGGSAAQRRYRHRGVTVFQDRVFFTYRNFLFALNRKTGKPIHHAIVWQDRRTAGFCDSLKKAGHEALVQQKTGLARRCWIFC